MLRPSSRHVFLWCFIAGLGGCTCVSDDDDDIGVGLGGQGGQGTGGTNVDESCVVASLSPAFGATDVPVAGATFQIAWNRAVDESSLDGAIHLVRLDDDVEVPVTVSVVDDKTVEVTPGGSLRFFASYGLQVGDGVTSKGDACVADSTAFTTPQPSPEPKDIAPSPANGMVVVDGFGIVASNGFRGLQIYDLSDPATPTLVSSVDTDEQPVSIATDGQYAYVPTGWDGVLIFNLSDPQAPKLEGIAGTPGFAVEAAPFTNGSRKLLAVADSLQGLRIIDVTNAQGPMQVSSINPSGDPTGSIIGLSIDGDTIAVAQNGQGFALVDASTPEAPVTLTSHAAEPVADTFGNIYAVTDVALDGQTLFIALGSKGFEAFDVSNPASPVFIDHELSPQGLCGGVGCADIITGMVASQGEIFASSFLTGAVRLHLESSTIVTDATLDVVGQSLSVVPDGDHFYVTGGRGLTVFDRDAADSAAPIFTEDKGTGSLRTTVVEGDHLYAVSASRGLETYSIANPAAPTLIDLDPTPGLQSDVQLLNVAVHEGKLVVGDGRAGFSVFDVSNPDDPQIIGSVPDADQIGAIEFIGDVAYLCNDNHGLWIVDYQSDPPALLQEINLDQQLTACRDMEVSGNYLFVAEGNSLGVYDISTPESPTFAGFLGLPTQDAVNSIALYGDYLLATTAVFDYEGTNNTTRRFLVFDISQPTSPKTVYRSEDLTDGGPVMRSGDKAFVSAGREGILIYDLADPTDPLLEGRVELPGVAGRVTIAPSGDLLYVSETGRGLTLVNTGTLPHD